MSSTSQRNSWSKAADGFSTCVPQRARHAQQAGVCACVPSIPSRCRRAARQRRGRRAAPLTARRFAAAHRAPAPSSRPCASRRASPCSRQTRRGSKRRRTAARA
eukprot:6188937-Pleurochrysis_carterae.AAC.2